MIKLAKKMLWTEGMLLRQQQFQHQERYFENQIQFRSQVLSAFAWGVYTLTLDKQCLTTRQLGVTQGSGIFPDGTAFEIGGNAQVPEYRLIPEGTQHMKVYLGTPLMSANSPSVALQQQAMKAVRYFSQPLEIDNYTTQNQNPATVDAGILQLQILLESDDISQYSTIPIARIDSVTAEKGCILDEHFLPTAMTCEACDQLASLNHELVSLLHHRSQTLAERATSPNRGDIANFSELLLLQIANRAKLLFEHFASDGMPHPVEWYRNALQLYGELIPLCSKAKLAQINFHYRHDDLTTSLLPLMQELRKLLQTVIEQNAVSIPLSENDAGLFIGTIDNINLINHADFVLAVKADMPAQVLTHRVPTQIKIAPLTQINALVTAQVPGIALEPLAVAPPQIPYYAGYNYFTLSAKSELWEVVKACQGLAIHVGGQFPELKLACWAIRR